MDTLPIGQRAYPGSTNGGKCSWDTAPSGLRDIAPNVSSGSTSNRLPADRCRISSMGSTILASGARKAVLLQQAAKQAHTTGRGQGARVDHGEIGSRHFLMAAPGPVTSHSSPCFMACHSLRWRMRMVLAANDAKPQPPSPWSSTQKP